ncbi:MAG: DUF5667 domain-containing protein, partial [Anaerolineae bacterium]
MINANFEAILDECLARLRRGDTLENCLADFPQQAVQLRPYLTIAAHISQTPPPQPRETAVANGRARMFAAVDAQFSQSGKQPVSFAALLRYASRKWSDWTSTKEIDAMKFVTRLAIAMVIVLFVGGAAAVTTSAQTLPGDTLYPVKRIVENVRLVFAGNESARQTLETELTQERLREIKALMANGRQEIVEFSGPLAPTGDGGWQVNGFSLRITPQTQIEGELAAGRITAVRAQIMNDGTLTALHLRVQTTPSTSPQDPYPGPNPSTTPVPSHTPMTTDMPGPGPQPSHTPMHNPTDMPGPSPHPSQTPMPNPTDMPGPGPM